ncbi:MAG TPA: zinc ribbon domain-containing protein [Clostridiales bacterium]|nr:zinc ribbon domain-containing protein [Clostridiales bacterium]
MMTCVNCGANVPDGTQFCARCGSNQFLTQQQPEVQQNMQQQWQPQQPPQPQQVPPVYGRRLILNSRPVHSNRLMFSSR